MENALKWGWVWLVLCLVVAACSRDPLDEGQAADAVEGADATRAVDAAWAAFKPNTSSQDRANWDLIEVRQVTGQEVAERFDDEPAPGCWVGPTPQPNRAIRSSGAYWYVHWKARPATPIPVTPTLPPTAPPLIPEAHVREAEFLLDAADGRVVARRIYCVIY